MMGALVMCEGGDADTSGPITVKWIGTMTCNDCYDTAFNDDTLCRRQNYTLGAKDKRNQR